MKEEFENFEDKTKEEKIETLRKISEKINDGEVPSGLLQELDFEGKVTATVYDEDNNVKQVETETF